MITHSDEISIPEYWSNNGEMVLRESLPSDHPEHPYNYVKNLYNVDPRDYGIPRPETSKKVFRPVLD